MYRCLAIVVAGVMYAGTSPIMPVHASGTPVTVVITSQPSTVYGQSVMFTATVDAGATPVPTGTVTFRDNTALMTGGCAGTPTLVATTGTAAAASCSTTALAVGTQSITASYNGDTTYTAQPYTSAAITQTVNKAASSASGTSSQNPSVYSQTVIYTATEVATGAGAGTPTGTVSFNVGGTPITNCSARPLNGLSPDVATCQTDATGGDGTPLGVGNGSVQAVYGGDTNFLGNTSPVVTQVTTTASSAVVTSAVANPSSYGDPVVITATVTPAAPATATPTGTVLFRSNSVGIGSCNLTPPAVSGGGIATCSLSTLATGADNLVTVYSGDSNFSGATSPGYADTVNKAVPTVTVSSDHPLSADTGQVVTFTAGVTTGGSASAPTGTVTFTDSVDGTLCSNVALPAAQCAYTYALPANGHLSSDEGPHTVTAYYSGDTNFTGPTGTFVQQVRRTTYTTVQSNYLSSIFGQPVTFTSTTVDTNNLPVSGTYATFTADSSPIGGCANETVNASGQATCITTAIMAPSQVISVYYAGNPDYDLPSTANPTITQYVSMGNSATALSAPSANPIVSGQQVTFTATVSAVSPAVGTPQGNVMFESGGVGISGCGTESLSVGGIATCTTFGLQTPGADAITAVYAGSGNFSSSTSAVVTETVNKDSASYWNDESGFQGAGVPYTFTTGIVAGGLGSGVPTGTVTWTFSPGGVCVGTLGALVPGQAKCTGTWGGVGTVTLTSITYSGDADFNGFSVGPFSYTVAQDTTTATVSSSANPSATGQTVTYSSTVSPANMGTGVPALTGTITYNDNGTPIGTCTNLALGSTCAPPPYGSTGTHPITVTYSGDANYVTTTSPTLTQGVDIAGTTVVATSSDLTPVYSESVTLTATIGVTAPGGGVPGATGNVEFQSNGVNIASCAAQTVTAGVATCITTALALGADVITLNYSGDATFAASTAPNITVTVGQAAAHVNILNSGGATVSGQPAGLTATLSLTPPATGTPGPTGTVDFSGIAGCSAVALAGLTATCNATTLPVGSNNIGAIYSGDANYTGGVADCCFGQTVNVDPTTTVVTSSTGIPPSSATSATSVTGQLVTYTATITGNTPGGGSPGGLNPGTVTFANGGTPIGTCLDLPVIAGTAQCPVTHTGVGAQSIVATYSGDANYGGGPSAAFPQTVNQDSTTTVVTSSTTPAGTSVVGQSVTYTATTTANTPGGGDVSGGTATVSFLDGSSAISPACTNIVVPLGGIVNCVAGVLSSPGVHDITASYTGNINYFSNNSATFVQTVGTDGTTVVVTSLNNPSRTGQSTTYTATVTADTPGAGTPTGEVTFIDDGTGIGSCLTQLVNGGSPDIATCTVSYPIAGPHTLTAQYSHMMDPNFNDSPVSAPLTQTVGTADTTTTLGAEGASVTGQAVTYTATVTANAPGVGAPVGTVAFFNNGVAVGTCSAVSAPTATAACPITFASAGIYAITAQFTDTSGNFTNSPLSAAQTQTVNQAPTTIGLAPLSVATVSGQPTTYTATIAVAAPGAGPPAGAAPGGTVAFLAGGSAIGCPTQPVVALTATCTVTFAQSQSPLSITATYTGDANYSASAPSSPVTQTVGAATTTTTLASTGLNPSASGGTATFTATIAAVSPGTGTVSGPVDFQQDGTDITGCTAVTPVSNVATCATTNVVVPGPHNITAIFAGDGNYTGSTSGTVVQTVGSANTTTTVGATSSSVTGQAVTFTATVTANVVGAGPPVGTVAFFNNGVAVAAPCDAVSASAALCMITFPAAGTYPITAQFTPTNSSLFNSSPLSAPQTQTVNKAATTVGLASTVATVSGQPTTYTATIAVSTPGAGPPSGNAPGGTVVFMAGGVTIGSCSAQPVVGLTATCSDPLGFGHSQSPVSITATYTGDANFSGAGPSSAVTQTVGAATTTTTLASTGSNPSASGGTAIFQATIAAVSPGTTGTVTGTVDFKQDGADISGCTAVAPVANVATCTTTNVVVPGARNITAVFAGDGNYTTSTSGTVVQTVSSANTTTTLGATSSSVTGQAVTFTASVASVTPGAGTPAGTVAFFNNGAAVAACNAVSASAAQCAITFTAAGTYPITAQFSSTNGSFNSSPLSAAQTQTVNRASTTIGLAPAVATMSGQSTTYTATIAITTPGAGPPAGNAPGGTVVFMAGGVAIGSCSPQAVTALTATCSDTLGFGHSQSPLSITATYSGDANFSGVGPSSAVTQTVGMATTTTTLTSTGNNPSASGGTATFRAAIAITTPGGGTVSGPVDFMQDGSGITGCTAVTPVANVATCATTNVSVAGPHNIKAVFAGDGSYTTSSSGTVVQTVNDPNTAWINKLYHDLLNRPADAGGIAYFNQQLAQGTTRTQLSMVLMTSNEFRDDVVTAQYQRFFGNAPDSGGLTFWASQLADGTTDQSLSVSLASSAEFSAMHSSNTAFVTALYWAVFNRAPDSGGLTSWVNALNGGATRASVAHGFVYSDEANRQIVSGFYTTLLGRAADSGGVTYWAAQIDAGVTYETVEASFTGSAEYYGLAGQ
jgi:hypothetical protein